MESATEALKMAFAMFVFILALTISIIIFSKARETSEIVMMSVDETTYYEYMYSDSGADSVDSQGNRIVGLETIIPTLYKYDKERYRVEFKDASGNPLSIYQIRISNISNKSIYNTTNNTTVEDIYYFDIAAEEERAEPWVGNSEQIKLHLDAIFNGEKYHLPQYLESFTDYDPDYSSNPLNIKNSNNKKFIEQIGRIVTVEEDAIKGNKTTTKIVITYTQYN